MIKTKIKFHTQLIIGYVVIAILLTVAMISGYLAVANVITLDPSEQAAFLNKYAVYNALLFVFMFFSAGGVAFYFPRVIRLTLINLNQVADGMAAGKVDMKMEIKNQDEFGRLMKSFEKVIDSTRQQAQIAQEVANGNMTVEVTPRSEDDVMGQALKKMVTQNQYTLGNIREAAYQVTTSSAQVASASEALAQGSTEQASAIEQITASISDVADRTRQNASQANSAADLMAKAIAEVKKGNEEMQEMVVAMQDINRSSESISKIIKVIDDIAFQTNILALNAAVEAARAGEAGKGFAVVAEEVRNLAAKSAAAAAETAELIEDSIHKVEVGSKIANETAQALVEITTVVKESESIITDIAEASNYQATAIAQIDQAVGQVSQVVQNNSATSEECAAASVELSNQASRVREMISVYKLDGNEKNDVKLGHFGKVDKNEQIISLKDGFGKY